MLNNIMMDLAYWIIQITINKKDYCHPLNISADLCTIMHPVDNNNSNDNNNNNENKSYNNIVIMYSCTTEHSPGTWYIICYKMFKII